MAEKSYSGSTSASASASSSSLPQSLSGTCTTTDYLNTISFIGGADHFWCDVCEIGFTWKSKYDRHLVTDKHCNLAGVVSQLDRCSQQPQFPAMEVSSLWTIQN